MNTKQPTSPNLASQLGPTIIAKLRENVLDQFRIATEERFGQHSLGQAAPGLPFASIILTGEDSYELAMLFREFVNLKRGQPLETKESIDVIEREPVQ